MSIRFFHPNQVGGSIGNRRNSPSPPVAPQKRPLPFDRKSGFQVPHPKSGGPRRPPSAAEAFHFLPTATTSQNTAPHPLILAQKGPPLLSSSGCSSLRSFKTKPPPQNISRSSRFSESASGPFENCIVHPPPSCLSEEASPACFPPSGAPRAPTQSPDPIHPS